MKRLLLLGLVFLLTGCRTPDASTPALTPEAIKVFYPAALQPWADKLANCGSNNPRIALYFIQSDALETNLLVNEIGLELGQSTQDIPDSNLFQVGWEQVVVVVNKDNQLSQLSPDDLKSIFTGQVSNGENASNQAIQVWVLPDGEPTRTIFDNAIMSTQSLSSEALLAPDPTAMLEAISKNVDSIGYLPRSFLNAVDSTFTSKIKILQLESSLEAKLLQPVIAVSHNEPKGLLRNLLVCLQNITP
jgi:phosphate transport system substrate-binding protein